MDKLRMKPRRVKNGNKTNKPPCKRQEKWRQMAYADFERLQDNVTMVVERLELSLYTYLKTTDKKTAKDAMKVLRTNYPILRDMAHADVLDDSINVLLRALDTLFYPGNKH